MKTCLKTTDQQPVPALRGAHLPKGAAVGTETQKTSAGLQAQRRNMEARHRIPDEQRRITEARHRIPYAQRNIMEVQHRIPDAEAQSRVHRAQTQGAVPAILK